ncbi:hypothetical protein [Flavobacterium aestivum]|uniref:hypothetical protein n=1 Tax=Flavobacterium aestivum TaxID=3003257 RepID=UPI002482A0C9|nr:hypothetical protein [Flavobacterium aestivum]
MKKTLLIFLFIISCNSNKETKPTVCIERLEYEEFSNYKSKQPTLQINIKVEDSAILKKILKGRLKKIIIFSMKKGDRNVVHCIVSKIPLKKANSVSFLFWTKSFLPLNSDGQLHRENEDLLIITDKLSGDIGLIFDNDTIRAGSCSDNKVIIKLIKG